MMPHLLVRRFSDEESSRGIEQSIKQKHSDDDITKERLLSNSMHLDLRYMPGEKLLMIPEAISASSRSPQTPKCSVFPSPLSSLSAVFDSPHRSSPSSSVSSSNFFAVAPRVNTPVAELEDTSSAFTYSELEDTSACAIRSRRVVKSSPYVAKTNNIITRSLIVAVDQRFADYEAEIRYLRNSLANAEKSLFEVRTSLHEAKKAADDSSHALDAAQELIADREYELKMTKSVITELEEDVKHCQAHHPPPKPPSKLRGLDIAISRFNADMTCALGSSELRKSPARLSPATIGCKVDVAPKPREGGSSTTLATKATRLISVSHPGTPSPSGGETIAPKARPRSLGRRTGMQAQLTTEVLAAALSSAAGTSKPLETASVVKAPNGFSSSSGTLVQSTTATSNSSTVQAAQNSQPRGRRKRQSSASNLNLRGVQNSSPQSEAPALPPRPLMMNGGLGIVEASIDDIQEQKLRRKKGGFGEIFRRKDHVKDQNVSILNGMVYEMDYVGC